LITTTLTTITTSITSITNSTNSTLGTGNYTLETSLPTSSRFLVNSNTSSTVCTTGSTCYVTYVYSNYNTGVAPVIQKSITATSEIPVNWLTLMVIVLVAGVIITIVFKTMGKGDDGGSEGYSRY
jgi:hypothetical protein